MHRPLQVVTCGGREHIGARGLETLTFDLSTSKWSHGHPCHGFLPANTPFRSRRRARHGNRLTDRENGYQRLMSPPYGAGGIRSLLMTIKITFGCQSLVIQTQFANFDIRECRSINVCLVTLTGDLKVDMSLVQHQISLQILRRYRIYYVLIQMMNTSPVPYCPLRLGV